MKWLVIGLTVALLAWVLVAKDEIVEGSWQQVENKENCTVWNEHPQPNLTVTWTGGCSGGKANGNGKRVWRFLEDGAWKESSYTGAMRDGRMHGRGVNVWANGNRYEGDYSDEKMNGSGVFVWASGNRYEGDYRDDKPHGSGKYTRADGETYTGYWEDGCFKQGDRWMVVGTSRRACGF